MKVRTDDEVKTFNFKIKCIQDKVLFERVRVFKKSLEFEFKNSPRAKTILVFLKTYTFLKLKLVISSLKSSISILRTFLRQTLLVRLECNN